MNDHFYRIYPKKTHFGGQEIQFPVTYTLKVVMDTIRPEETNIHILEGVLAHLRIRHSTITERQSRTGKYTSYSVDVTLKDQETFAALYRDLAEIPTVRTAI